MTCVFRSFWFLCWYKRRPFLVYDQSCDQTYCPPLRSQEKSLGWIELGLTEIVSNIARNLFSAHSWVKQEFKTIEIGGGWVVVAEEGTSMKAVTCVEVRVREWSRLWWWECNGRGGGKWPSSSYERTFECDPPLGGLQDKTCAREMRSGVRTLHLAGAIHYPHTPLISAAFHIIAQPPSPTPLLKHKSHGSCAQNEHFRSGFSKYKTLHRASF